MIPVINLRGYTADDPLDRASDRTLNLLPKVVSAVVSMGLLYVVYFVANLAQLQYNWLYWVECAVFVFVFSPLFVTLRKSSSLILIAIVMVVGVPLDIYVEAHQRVQGLQALWTYPQGTFLSPLPFFIKTFIVFFGDGLMMGPVCLWLCRVIAGKIYPVKSEDRKPTKDEYESLFAKEWTEETVDKPQRDLAFYVLLILGISYLAYLSILIVGLIGVSPWPKQIEDLLTMTYVNPALAVNTFMKITLMVMLALIAAYNKSLRWHCTLGLFGGHLVSTIASIWFFIINDPSNALYHDFLRMSAIVDGGMVVIFLIILIYYRDLASQFDDAKEFPEFYSLPNRLMKRFYLAFGIVTLLMVPGVIAARYYLDGSKGLGAAYGFPDPQIANTLTKYVTLSLLAFLLSRREVLRDHLYRIITVAYTLGLVASLLWLLIGDIISGVAIQTRANGTTTFVDWYFMVHVLTDSIVILAIVGLRKMYYTVEYTISSVSPSTAQNILALHDALYVGTPEAHTAVLQSIDRHVAGIRGRKRGLINFPFWVIERITSVSGGFRPNFSTMSRDEQRYFLWKYILRTPIDRARAFVPDLADLMYKLGGAGHALITLGHYSQLQARDQIGYIPPDARDRTQGDYPAYPPPFKKVADMPDGPSSSANDRPFPPANKRPLIAPRVVTPVKDHEIPDDADYVIMGSGAGGAVMAYRLACEVDDPSRILVVERGPRFSPLQDFNDDEMEMIRKLYKEGGLQQTKRFDLMILQGECVGGTTVINNAICFQMPPHIRQQWQNEFGIDLSTIDTEYESIAKELEIGPIADDGINQIVKEKFLKGVREYNKTIHDGTPLKEEVLQANMRNVMGDGLCNLGNKRMRKRSMLETYIPWAEQRGVKVVAETSVVRCIANGRRAESVLLRTDLGNLKQVEVKKAVIVAGGVIASSHVLMRSGLSGNVGQGLSCNFAFPVAFKFPDKIDAFDGVQITIGALDAKNRAIFETYFNPPGSFAISLPFYFNRLQATMNDYRRLLNFGALVGSEPNGTIDPTANWIDGRAFSWELGAQDKNRIKYALSTLLKIGLRAGATHAILPTSLGLEIPLTERNVERFANTLASYPLGMNDLRLTTAHPQGGNRMAHRSSPNSGVRVVDEDFLVEGFDNVFVADASVFPTGITVNPQWTIMALSSLASKKVLMKTST